MSLNVVPCPTKLTYNNASLLPIRYKEGQVLEPSERLLISNEGQSYKLEVVKTEHADRGEYSVEVENRMGKASSKGTLEIEGKVKYHSFFSFIFSYVDLLS